MTRGLGVLVISGSAAIEFRCRGNPQGGKITANELGIRRMSGKGSTPGTKRSAERRIGSGRRKCRAIAICLPAVIGVLITVSAGGGALAQKSGGILRVYSADSPPGLNIYEQATPWGQGPLMSVYNNLILFVGIGLGGRRRAATRPRAALAGIRRHRRSRSWRRYMVE
jgi:hypothetical protein